MKPLIFFKKKKFITIDKFFPHFKFSKKDKIIDIKPLKKSGKNDLTFFDSIKYKESASTTKSLYCITTTKLEKFLPKNTKKIIVKNVLFELANALKKLYPDADIDYPDTSLKLYSKYKYKAVKFCNNALIGKNVKIGQNTIIGTNSIIEHDVVIGENCVLGSNVIIKNAIIGNNVVIQDNSKIGQKGFGFIPIKGKNIKFPHIGKVVILDNVEIASGCTIDRGSIDDTVIGENSYLDNQVHIAHNVKIGENTIIAGQVGIAGSSIIGSCVRIGGQAGISGHLKVGDNVDIAGGSGVIKDIPNNTKVMGYPAKNIRKFLKENK